MRNDLSALVTSLRLCEQGLWPVALHGFGDTIPTQDGPKLSKGKEPIAKEWGKVRPTEAVLRKTFQDNPRAGVGLVLGPGGGVVDMEIDGDEGEESLLKLCGGEVAETMGWTSRRGPHRLFRWDERLAGIDPKQRAKLTLPQLPGLELRLGQNRQAQSACPPSMG